MKIPTPKEWSKYFALRKRKAIDLIVVKVLAESDYEDSIKMTKKALKKDAEMIESANRVYNKLNKSIKKGI